MKEKENCSVIEFYIKHAYEWSVIRRKNFREKYWIKRFLTLIPAKGDILDVGCGAGDPVGGYIIGRGYTLTGVDSSAPLIDLCKNKYPLHKWLERDMRTLSLNKKFDGIVVWDSFFHLSRDEQRNMFHIFKTHSHEGTILIFTSGNHDGEVVGRFLDDDLYHSSLSPEEYRNLLLTNGFKILDHVQDDPCCERTVWMAQYS